MNTQEEFKFGLENPTKEFKEHLKLPLNDRIVLSAPFGAGKTYFLNEFFKDHPEYDAIHIYPVNYSVASNEDIFELIKYDILFELMRKGVEFENVDFGKLDYLPFFLAENKEATLGVLTPLLSFVPKVGKALPDIAERLISLFKEFEKKHKAIQINDKDSVISYLESFTKVKGSIYEEDFYTQVICQLVEQLKQQKEEQNEPKKTVLIIDDLDRIDPEHIFRILNVLSAQIDREGGDNKFDFDKIILVFDQENVRNIFKNRYGADVDFSGYIDKFYSYKIFEFYNLEGIKQKIRGLLDTINIENKNFNLSTTNSQFVDGVIYVFEKLISANVLTVRRLLKVLNSNLDYQHGKVYFKSLNESRRETLFNIFILTRLLLLIYDNWEEIIASLEEIKPRIHEDLDKDLKFAMEEVIGQCVLLLDLNNHRFLASQKDAYKYVHPGTNYLIEYYIRDLDLEGKYLVFIQDIRIDNHDLEIVFRTILLDTIKMIRDENLLKLNL